MAVLTENSVGTLETHSLVEVFRWIEGQKFSGVIVLQNEALKKSFVFEHGKPIAARSNIKGESLGQILVKANVITEPQLSKSLEMIEGKEALMQGEALLNLGLINHNQLNEFLALQMVERICEVLVWKQGKFGLVPSVPKEVSRISIDQTLMAIVFRGLLKKYQNPEEASKLSSTAKPIPVGGLGDAVNDLKLVGKEMAFLRSINGVFSVQEIISKGRMDESMVRAMILALRDCGLVRIEESKLEATKSVEKPVQSLDVEGLTRELKMRFEGLKEGDLFAVLGIARTASDAEVKKAYFDLAKRFHPDKIGKLLGPENRDLVEQYFAKISEAHSILSDPNEREEYVATLELEESGMTQDRATDILKSEVEYQKGLVLMRKGKFAEAAELFQEAIQLYQEEADYHLQLAWCLYRNAAKTKERSDVTKAKNLINKAIELNPNSAQPFYYLGMIAKGDGELPRAKNYFEKATSIAPNHQEATSELRLLNMRQEKDKGSGSLKALFSKKKSS